MDSALIVLTNCPDNEVADRIAGELIDSRQAACVNRLAPVVSTYRWQGRIEQVSETPLMVKTTRERYAEVERTIRTLHPYEVPEIVALPVVAGFAPYLRWIDDETQPTLLA